MKLPFTQVDAFADRPFTGNSAAVMLLDDWLDDATLQAIAMENNLSETAFLVADTGGASDYELRWFTPTVEAAMCGHATLASGHVMIGQRERVTFRTRKAGVLSVSRAGDRYALDLPAITVAPARHDALLAALGIAEAELYETVTGAEQTMIVALPDEATVRSLAPDFKALAAIELMAIATAPGDDTDIVSRVFVPAWGIDEDPVTGAAHAALTPFWAGRLGRDFFSAYQASTRGGRLECRLAGDRVVLTGRCATVIEGEFLLS